MKIVASNHADTLRRPGAAQARVVDLVADDLRGLLDGAAEAVPARLLRLARAADAARAPAGLAA